MNSVNIVPMDMPEAITTPGGREMVGFPNVLARLNIGEFHGCVPRSAFNRAGIRIVCGYDGVVHQHRGIVFELELAARDQLIANRDAF
jgi:hypothetical protein